MMSIPNRYYSNGTRYPVPNIVYYGSNTPSGDYWVVVVGAKGRLGQGQAGEQNCEDNFRLTNTSWFCYILHVQGSTAK